MDSVNKKLKLKMKLNFRFEIIILKNGIPNYHLLLSFMQTKKFEEEEENVYLYYCVIFLKAVYGNIKGLGGIVCKICL